jgi:hypothetical protein
MHVLLLTSLAVLAQLQGPDPRIAAPPPQSASEDHAAIHREMERLFKEVELEQRHIDRLLLDAGTAHVASQPKAAASVGEFVTQARDGSRLVTRDIDRILELAGNHTHQGGT